MENPFYSIQKADEIPDNEIVDLFVPSACSIWNEVQQPVNQLILGPRGAGKTMLLKRLHYLNALLHGTSYCMGIYIQLSRLSNLFRHVFRPCPSCNIHVGQQLYVDYLCSSILREIVQSMNHCISDHSLTLTQEQVQQVAHRYTDATTLEGVIDFCDRLQTDVETHTLSWGLEGTPTWRPVFGIASSPGHMTEAVLDVFSKSLSEPVHLCLLLDESCPIPTECQEVINVLLQRGRPFKTKLAVRPYEWQTLNTALGVPVEENTDFRRLFIEYPDELSHQYVAQMRAIANQVLDTRVVKCAPPPGGWPQCASLEISQIFPDRGSIDVDNAGFDEICALSASSPQNLLTICSTIFSIANDDGLFENNQVPQVPPNVQSQALASCSADTERSVPDPAVKAFLRALVLEIKKKDLAERGLTVKVVCDTPDMFPTLGLPEEVGSLLKSAFATGFLRPTARERLSLWDVPAEFVISRALLPSHRMPLRLPTQKEIRINVAFIKDKCRERIGGPPTLHPDLEGTTFSAFLSTSFSPMAAEDRMSIKRELAKIGIECSDIEDAGREQFLFTDVFKKIKAHDVVIFNATEPRPYTLFELGLSAGLNTPKPIIAIFDDKGNDDNVRLIDRCMRLLPIEIYDLSQDRLSAMASRVRRTIINLHGKKSEFLAVEATGNTLRPKTNSKNIYVSFPSLPERERILQTLRPILEAKGYQLITEADGQLVQANDLQTPIFCATLAGYVIVDTSGNSQPDLLQCYKLGIACSRYRWPVLHLQKRGMDHRAVLDTAPSTYMNWNTVQNVADAIASFVEECDSTRNGVRAKARKNREKNSSR